jgi:hypothetical protein
LLKYVESRFRKKFGTNEKNIARNEKDYQV